MEFEATVRGNPKSNILVGKIASVTLFPLIGKKVKVTIQEVTE